MFVEGLCWTQTAERQASRMRRLYLEAVLRQQVEFFDTSGPSSQATTFRVISTISDDADTVQDFLAEKVSPSFLAPLHALHAVPGRLISLHSCFSCPTSWRT
jgi:ATP-binding cassette subfamily B (MDR/TAP) protein 1